MGSELGIQRFLELSLVTRIVCVVIPLTIVYQIGIWVYNFKFHPLAQVPGPKLWAISRLPHESSLVRGRLHKDLRALHEKYGDVVRVTPDGLSFIHPEAWNDIFNRKPGQKNLPQKDLKRLSDGLKVNGAPELLTADDETHSRHRRFLSHAFSDRALRDQHQPLIQNLVDSLINQLRVRAKDARESQKLDLSLWLHLTTFDIIGDLALGETFDCLDKGDYHPWLRIIFEGVKAYTFLGSVRQYPWVDWLLQLFVSRYISEVIREHQQLTIEKVTRRLSQESDRGDFMSQITKHKGTMREMSRDEIMSNFNLLIPAGAETSAAGMASCMYHLLRSPGVYRKLTKEIRDTFKSEREITFEALANIPYLEACINESMRIYPPLPMSSFRTGAPEGSLVRGIFIPNNVSVSIYQWATYHCSCNFKNPDVFDPSRFLGNPLYEDDRRDVFKPFSVGNRNCIGKYLALAEIRLVVARILYNFDLELLPESENWVDQPAYLVWEKDAMWVKIKARDFSV